MKAPRADGAAAAPPGAVAAVGRDEAIDVLRGLAMFLLLVNHVEVASWWGLLTRERIGPVTGAELFVVLSGVVLGMVSRSRLARGGMAAATRPVLRRALTLWAVAAVVGGSVYALGLLPGVDASAVTTWRDPATGAVHDLYGADRGLLPVARDVLLLDAAPWVFNIMGLYVALLVASPLVLWALSRRAVVPVLAVSWGLYALHVAHPMRLLPAQSEEPFPVLAWQLIFVHGLVVGFHRRELGSLARRRAGRLLPAAAAGVALLCLFYTWNNPWLGLPHLGLIPEDAFGRAYALAFERTTPGLGRLLDLAAIVLVGHALLTRLPGLRRRVGAVLAPLGRASLYVFTVHVYLVLLVAQVPGIEGAGRLVGTLVQALVVAAAWLLVRRRVLFDVIPR